MKLPGPVEERLRTAIQKRGSICLALIDSEDIELSKASKMAKSAENAGAEGILVGGSTVIDQIELDSVVKAIKKVVSIPIILFPGNITGISPNANAMFFSSLLNSDNPYFITEAQALGALTVKKYSLEAIPMGYIIIGDGGATGFIGRARGIPSSKPNLAVMYALAAQFMGMRFLYLEAGSGVTSHISSQIVKAVRHQYEGTLIVGGGITSTASAIEVVKSGADVIVVGTLLESGDFRTQLMQIVSSISNVRDRNL
jgi:phosphoglycerol geranylgeranyltransferase